MGARELLALLEDSRRRLEGVGRYDPAIKACAAGLQRMEALLARPPRVVLLGEVNAGKTSVADLLLGVGLLPASVVANTRLPLLIRYAPTTALYAVTDRGRRPLTEADFDGTNATRMRALEIGLPSERLREFEILDTPGLSGAGSDDSAAGDIRLWCTVATRAWTESERAYWSALPRRNRHNAMLVATHKDALDDQADAIKIERRLRATAGDLFRDVILVSATDAEKSRRTNGRPSDASAITLLGQVRVWAGEIRERRADKIEKIVRRLARLTFHQLARSQLRATEARILKDWEADCAMLLDGMASGADLPGTMRQLLRRFGQAVEQARPGSIERGDYPSFPGGSGRPVQKPGAAGRRFARLIVADLTTLLRFELAREGSRDPMLHADHVVARAVLMPLARLDKEFNDVERLLSAGSVAATAADLPSNPEQLLERPFARARGN